GPRSTDGRGRPPPRLPKPGRMPPASGPLDPADRRPTSRAWGCTLGPRRSTMKRRSVHDVMTRPLVTVAPTATYHEIGDAMVSRRITALPVVDANGFVLGIVSEADLLHKVEFAGVAPAHHLIERRRARESRVKADAVVAADLMSKPAITIRPDETI